MFKQKIMDQAGLVGAIRESPPTVTPFVEPLSSNRFFCRKGPEIILSSLGGAKRAEEKNARPSVPGGQHPHGFLTFFANQRVQEAGEGIPDDLQIPFQLPVS
jgi:hypothetical protein